MERVAFNRGSDSHWEKCLSFTFTPTFAPRFTPRFPAKFASRLAACFALAALCSSVSAAQQSAPPPNPDPAAQTQPQAPAQDQAAPSTQTPQSDADKAAADKAGADKDKNGQDPKGAAGTASGTSSTGTSTSGTSKDRLFYALPNFLTLENGAHVPPLTTKQKFAVVARGQFDKIQFAWYGLLSGISQAENSEPGFGQGWPAYGKRYGTAFADGGVENFTVQAILPTILRQDPRFFQSGAGGFFHRTGYAISRIFVTRTDSGHAQVNFSEIFGSALAASISTYSYHPKSTYISTPTNPHLFIPSDRTLRNTASVWGTQVSYDTLTIVIKEFWPDIHRKLSHKHKVDVAAPSSNP
jgi:hypothetical protein